MAVVQRKVDKFKDAQKLQVKTVMKRIQREREELLMRRRNEADAIIRRNKNEIQDIQEKQKVEMRTMVDFLRFSLGKRAPKSVEQQ